MGELLTYTLSVTNQHPTAILHNIVLSDTLPAGTVFASSDMTYTLAGNLVTWQTPSLAPGATWRVGLTVRVLPEAGFMIENLAYRASSEEGPDLVQGAPVSTSVWHTIILPVIVQGIP